MSLTMHQRKAITQELASRYQNARKKNRSRMLAEFTALTGYNRAYAAFVLRNWGRKRLLTINGVRTIYVFGSQRKRKPTKRPRIYDQRIVPPLKSLWALSGGLCSKRLAVFIRTTLPVLERFEELLVDPDTNSSRSVRQPLIDSWLRSEKNFASKVVRPPNRERY